MDRGYDFHQQNILRSSAEWPFEKCYLPEVSYMEESPGLRPGNQKRILNQLHTFSRLSLNQRAYDASYSGGKIPTQCG